MNRQAQYLLAVILLALVFSAPGKDIAFRGYTWTVRSGKGGPGPNAWDENNVFWASVVHELSGSPEYRIYYTGNGGAGEWARNAIGYATWGTSGGATDVNRVIDRSVAPTRFDANQVAGGSVLQSALQIVAKGIIGVKYGLSTAAGLMLSLISLFMVLGSNALSRRIRGYGAF